MTIVPSGSFRFPPFRPKNLSTLTDILFYGDAWHRAGENLWCVDEDLPNGGLIVHTVNRVALAQVDTRLPGVVDALMDAVGGAAITKISQCLRCTVCNIWQNNVMALPEPAGFPQRYVEDFDCLFIDNKTGLFHIGVDYYEIATTPAGDTYAHIVEYALTPVAGEWLDKLSDNGANKVRHAWDLLYNHHEIAQLLKASKPVTLEDRTPHLPDDLID